jgi:uncharacterized protein with PIN domain
VKNTRVEPRTSNFEPERPSGATRCPLCKKPLVTVTKDESELDRDSAGCFDCKICAFAPFVEWHAFHGDREH